jgi:hypothetical protein
MWSLWLRFFLQTISIVRYKILRLEVEKIISFWSLAHMSISTYFMPNIYQNGPEILGVKKLNRNFPRAMGFKLWEESIYTKNYHDFCCLQICLFFNIIIFSAYIQSCSKKLLLQKTIFLLIFPFVTSLLKCPFVEFF